MLVSTVVLPEAFSAANYADPTYHLNTEVFLRGVHSNGLILVDAEDRLYNELFDHVENLAGVCKGMTTHALFEELVKQKRQSNGRFIKTGSTFEQSRQTLEVATSVAIRSKADALLVDPANHASLAAGVPSVTQVISVADYINSSTELERQRLTQVLPSLDKMPADQFEKIIARATKFSPWLRFYDKQIGKAGDNLNRFCKGIERILRLWVDAAAFPPKQLQAEIITVVDDHAYGGPEEAYKRVVARLLSPLQKSIGIDIRLSFKQDRDSICHARYLESRSAAILFERGFDFVKNDGRLRRAIISLDSANSEHLDEYRRLPEYVPATEGITP